MVVCKKFETIMLEWWVVFFIWKADVKAQQTKPFNENSLCNVQWGQKFLSKDTSLITIHIKFRKSDADNRSNVWNVHC